MEATQVSKFEIIGSFVVHLYFNEFFIQAKKLYNNKSYTSVLEAYKNILCDYSQFVKTPKFFKNIILGINMNCATVTIYTSMNENECIVFMAKEFIPTNIFDTVSFDNKKSILNIILTNCLLQFSQSIILNHLTIITEDRTGKTVSILQDLFLQIIKMEKDKMFSKFINPSPNTVPVKLFNSIQVKLKELVATKKELMIQNHKLTIDNKRLTEQLTKMTNEVGTIDKKQHSFEEANTKLMQTIKTLNSTLSENHETIDTLKAQLEELTKKDTQTELDELDTNDIFITTNQHANKLKDITNEFDYNHSPSFTSNLEFDNEDDE